MATLTTHSVLLTGLELDGVLAAATSGGDDCQTGTGVLLVVKNADASDHVVTLDVPLVIDGDLNVPNRTVTVAAGKTAFIPVTDRYKENGRAQITYDGVTSVSVAVIRVATS